MKLLLPDVVIAPGGDVKREEDISQIRLLLNLPQKRVI